MHSGFLRYQRVLVELSKGYLGPILEAKKQHVELRRPEDEAFRVLFYGFTEISNTFDALQLIETLAGINPPRSKQVKKRTILNLLLELTFKRFTYSGFVSKIMQRRYFAFTTSPLVFYLK